VPEHYRIKNKQSHVLLPCRAHLPTKVEGYLLEYNSSPTLLGCCLLFFGL